MKNILKTREANKVFYLTGAKDVTTWKNQPGVEIVTYTNAAKQLCSLIWYGKQSKPSKHYAWPTEEKREAYVAERIATVAAREADKKAAKLAKKNAVHPYKVGDILTGSWGYDQTNVDTYQITKVKGKAIWMKEIAQEITEHTGPMACYVKPVKDAFIEGKKEIKKIPQCWISKGRYQEGEAVPSFYVRMASYLSLTLWDGKPKYNSWYA